MFNREIRKIHERIWELLATAAISFGFNLVMAALISYTVLTG